MKIGYKRFYGISVIEHFGLMPDEKKVYKRIAKRKWDKILLKNESLQN